MNPTKKQFADFHRKVMDAFDDLPLGLTDGDKVVITLRRDGEDLVARTASHRRQNWHYRKYAESPFSDEWNSLNDTDGRLKCEPDVLPESKVRDHILLAEDLQDSLEACATTNEEGMLEQVEEMIAFAYGVLHSRGLPVPAGFAETFNKAK